MKKIFTSLMLLAAVATVNAEEIQIGSLVDASSTTSYPWYSSYECSASEMVYTAADLADLPAGTISKLEYAVIGGQMTYCHFMIWLENTDANEVQAATDGKFYPVENMTKVYDTAGKGYALNERTVKAFTDVTPANPGYLDFELDTPFEYTGGGLRIHFEALGSNWCMDEFAFIVDFAKENESGYKNAGVQFDFTETGMRNRAVACERSFPIIRYTITPGSTTGIKSVAAEQKAQKAIVDGKMVIVRDGKSYNVMGIEL